MVLLHSWIDNGISVSKSSYFGGFIQKFMFFCLPLGVETSITKFLEAAKALEADFLRKQMYSHVNHPQEVTQEVRSRIK